MTREVLRVENVGKNYPSYRSEFQRFARWFGFPVSPATNFWAVRGINLSICEGETVALIGQNGAGKSTLLKLITGTIPPNEGRLALGGRVSAILELGLGFNSEFTGRQNVMHSGGLLGHTDVELLGLMEWIEAFAEIGEHFDLPVRTYSSGMMARLAFALATAVRPELLIVDEVLSVGDSYFQHKSFNRIREFRKEGSTILFVTHGMPTVRELCDRVILMDKGRILKDGLPDEVVDYYNALIAEKENAKLSIEQRRRKDGWLLSRSGTFEAEITDIELSENGGTEPIAIARVGQKLTLKVEVAINSNIDSLVFGIMIRDRTGHIVWGTNTWHTKQALRCVVPGERFRFSVDFECSLGPGSYSISPALVSSDTHLENNYEWVDNVVVFEVLNTDRPVFIGSCNLDASFRVESVVT